MILISDRAKTVTGEDGSSLSYEGVFFIPPHRLGDASARFFLSMVKESGLSPAIRKTKGNFYAVYTDVNGKRFAFVDNGAIYLAYAGKGEISSDFFNLLEKFSPSVNDMDLWALFEILHNGVIHTDRTPIKEVRRIGRDEVINLDDEGKICSEPKGLSDPFVIDDSAPSFDNVFGGILESIKGEHISIDLTGGLDTRLTLGLLLSHNIEFETASSGILGHPDFEIPITLARLGGFENYPYLHNPTTLQDDIEPLIEAFDCLTNSVALHRYYRMINERLNRGVTLALLSAGGGFFRDFWWLSDWPIFNKKKPNIAALYYRRMATRIEFALFKGTILKEIALNFNENTVKNLEAKYGGRSPARLANDACAYFYHVHGIGSAGLTGYNRFIPTLGHFYDPELLLTGANMPIKLRRMNGFIRQIVSASNPAIAKVRTDRGQSLSDKRMDRFIDELQFIFDIGGRALRRIRHRLTGKAVHKEPNHPEYMRLVRALPQYRDSLKMCQKLNLVNNSLDPTDIPNRFIGSIIAVGELLRRAGV